MRNLGGTSGQVTVTGVLRRTAWADERAQFGDF